MYHRYCLLTFLHTYGNMIGLGFAVHKPSCMDTYEEIFVKNPETLSPLMRVGLVAVFATFWLFTSGVVYLIGSITGALNVPAGLLDHWLQTQGVVLPPITHPAGVVAALIALPIVVLGALVIRSLGKAFPPTEFP